MVMKNYKFEYCVIKFLFELDDFYIIVKIGMF